MTLSNTKLILVALSLNLITSGLFAEKMVWNLESFTKAPQSYPVPERNVGNVRALFLDGPKWHGKPTRFFAYYGLPRTTKPGEKVPGMVLVHGGLGTAFPEWVKKWNERGYAAIAIDTTGSINADGKGKRQRHQQGGPDGWGSFSQMKSDYHDVWSYHATADIMLANSFLAAQPEVDSQRIGITGISWGGYLTCMAASNDSRFRVAIPVYGCGYLYESPRYQQILNSKADIKQKWIETCDPSLYLANAQMPFLWVNGTNDFAFAMNAWQKSYRLPRTNRRIALRPKMPHSQKEGSNVAEVYAFADLYLKGTKDNMLSISKQGQNGKLAWVLWSGNPSPAKAEFWYTTDTNPIWKERAWQVAAASVDAGKKTVRCQIPEHTAAYFFNLYSPDNLLTSSEHVTLRKAGKPTPTITTGPPGTVLDEDFESHAVGSAPTGIQAVPGMKPITVTDEAAAVGKQSLKFQDSDQGKHWLPMRHFWFKGNRQISRGKVTLSFDIMQSKESPGKFSIEMRDYTGTSWKNGPLLTLKEDGKATLNGTEALPIPAGQWSHFAIAFTLGEKQYTCNQTVNGKTKQFQIPIPDFTKISWLGFIAGDRKKAATYIDNVKFSVQEQ